MLMQAHARGASPLGATKRSSHVTVQRCHFRPSFQLVEIVRPLLHHATSLGEVLRVVVGGADLVAFVMGKLAFDPIGMKAHFV
jgi:hypothetical protein